MQATRKAKNSFVEKLVVYNLIFMSLTNSAESSSETVIFGELINEIINNYFIKYRCVAYITDNEEDIDYAPPDIEIFHISIGGIGSVVEEIEENDTLDANAVSKGTKAFERLLIQALDASCEGYIIQVKNPRSIVYSFARATRRCLTRKDRSYVFLSFDSQFDPQDIFSLKEMNFMPNLIVARTSRDSKVRKPHDIERITVAEERRSSAEDTNFVKTQSRALDINQNFGNLYLSQNLEPSNYFKNHFNGSVVTNSNTETNDICIEVITHKFTGQENSNMEVFLDLWRWNGLKYQFVYGNNLFPDKLTNLDGKQLRLISFPWAQFVVSDENADPPVEDGLDVLIFKEFSKQFNSTLKLNLDVVNLWGYLFENGTGTGLQGDIMTDRADFAIAALYIWHSSYQWFDFTDCYYKTEVICLAPKPKGLPKWMSPILPFKGIVWCFVGTSLLIVAITFYTLNRTSGFILGGAREERYNNLVNSVLVTIGLFLEQSPPENSGPGNSIQRIFNILVASIMVFSLLLNTAYDSGLSSCLTIPQFERPTDTIQDLVDKNIPWVANHVSWIWSIWKTDDEPMIEELVKHFRIWDENKISEMARKGKISFPMERTPAGNYAVGLTLTKDMIEAQRIMKEALYWSSVTIWARKNSAYIRKLNTLLGKLCSAGILLYWDSATVRKYFSLADQIAITRSVDLVDEDGPTKLTMDHVEGMFIILAIGLLLSLVVFLNELLVFWFFNRNMKKLKS